MFQYMTDSSTMTGHCNHFRPEFQHSGDRLLIHIQYASLQIHEHTNINFTAQVISQITNVK